MPQDVNALRQLFLGQGQGELVLSLRTDIYEPISDKNLRAIIAKASDINVLLKDAERETRERDRLVLANFLAEHHVIESDVAFLPFIARYQQMFVAYRKSDAKLIGFLEIQPDLLGGKPE